MIKKPLNKIILIASIAIICAMEAGCSQGKGDTYATDSSEQSSSNVEPNTISITDDSDKISNDTGDGAPAKGETEPMTSNNSAKLESDDESYSMLTYTKAPNDNSKIEIQYPYFSDNALDPVNKIIYNKVQGLSQLDPSLFPADTGLTIDYKSAVTLHNSKIVSIIFWGTSNIQGSAYPTDNLYPLNIDLKTLKEITLQDLYQTNKDFEQVFFDKAFFPTNPITSYDAASFPEMLKLQTPEYEPVDPFSIPGNVSCFLKPDGIVLSMPAVHATGSDHFEAQLEYGDIQQFYLPQSDDWKPSTMSSEKLPSTADTQSKTFRVRDILVPESPILNHTPFMLVNIDDILSNKPDLIKTESTEHANGHYIYWKGDGIVYVTHSSGKDLVSVILDKKGFSLECGLKVGMEESGISQLKLPFKQFSKEDLADDTKSIEFGSSLVRDENSPFNTEDFDSLYVYVGAIPDDEMTAYGITSTSCISIVALIKDGGISNIILDMPTAG